MAARGGASQYKGVSRKTVSKFFHAALGAANFYATFDTEELAAKAYDKCVARRRARQAARGRDDAC